MTPTDTREKGLETLIVESFVGEAECEPDEEALAGKVDL